MRFLPFLLLLACQPEPTIPPPPAAAPTAPAAHDHHGAAGDHGHAARHGGIQRELEDMHVEALLQSDGVRFYLTDKDNQPLSPEGWTGSAVISGPAGVVTAPLAPMSDHLHATATLEQGKPASVVLTLTRDGKARSASFETEAVGTEFHDHTSLHGGRVGMWGHYHVELLARDGAYQVWLSDASRGAVTGEMTGVVVESGQRIPLVADPATGALLAKSDKAGTLPVTVEVTVGGQNITLPFEVGQDRQEGRGEHGHHGH